MMNRNRSKAMALMRILMIIAFIDVLVDAGVSNLSGANTHNRIKSTIAFLRTKARNAINNLLALHNYPKNFDGLREAAKKHNAGDIHTQLAIYLNAFYKDINKIPCPIGGFWSVSINNDSIIFQDRPGAAATFKAVYTLNNGKLESIVITPLDTINSHMTMTSV